MAYTVFVSSTYVDLIKYRDAVSQRLRKAGYVPSEMESFGARDQKPVEVCLQEVADADLFVGIYAYRYGFVPPDSAVSLTEQELLEAEKRGKPIFCFLVNEKQKWSEKFREGGDGATRLAALKQRICAQNVVDFFTTPDHLAGNVVAALAKWERTHAAKLPPKLLLLLENVECWIKDVLRETAPEDQRLHIGREERPDAVGRPAPEEAGLEVGAGVVAESIQDIFRRQGRSLLILGSPGSGKTIALLDLAHGLARELSRDPGVPVVFHLASWKGKDRSLVDWMARELAQRYHAGSKAAVAKWIKRDQILPLLDGLDEVEPACRPDCVDAINAYLEDHGVFPGIAVTCTTQVNDELPVHLQLKTAVALRPLDPAQIDKHLGAGPELDGLRAAMASDADLRELATLPLMLILFERTYRNAAPEDLPSGRTALVERAWGDYVKHVLEPGLKLPRAREEAGRFHRLRNLLPWNRYKSRTEKSVAPPTGRYPPSRARSSLAWLARGMAEHDPALFQVERLQPAWLTSGWQVFAYAILSRSLGGCLLGLPIALAFEPKLAAAALLAGALVGAVEVIRLRRRATPTGNSIAMVGRWIGWTLLLGGVAFLAVLLLGIPFWVDAAPDSERSWRFDILVRVSLLFGLLFGLVFSVRGRGRGGHSDIRVAEALVWTSWSWRGTALGASSLAILSLACWVLFLLGSDASLSYLRGGDFWVPFTLTAALLGGLLFGVFGGLEGTALKEKKWPNLGTWLALRNARVVGLRVGLATMLGLGLVLGVLAFAGRTPQGTLPWIPLKAGLAVGIWAGLAYSGLDFVQHFSLRLVMRLAKLMPGRLVGFLDHAVERGLLQRLGGSYQFWHPKLRDWFASRR